MEENLRRGQYFRIMFWDGNLQGVLPSHPAGGIKKARSPGKEVVGMDDVLDGQLEQRVTGILILVASLFHTYLKEIGSTNLAVEESPDCNLQSLVLVPWQAMVYIHPTRGYGAVITVKTNNIGKAITITVSSEQCGLKLWHPMRTGSNYLAKKKFEVHVPEENGKKKKQKIIYAGITKVVMTEQTPIYIIYHSKTQKATTSFYIQWYDKDGFSVDATSQNLLNGESRSASGATSSIVALCSEVQKYLL